MPNKKKQLISHQKVAKEEGVGISRYHLERARTRLQTFLGSSAVNLIIAFLILLSVGLIFWEFFLPAGLRRDQIADINDTLTWFFIVELTLRFLVAPNKRIYFSNYWIDILSVLPTFRVFRSLRVLRLLRILRLARASMLLLKESGWLSARLERYFGNFGFLALTAMLLIVCAAIALISAENPNPSAGISGSQLARGLWETTFLFISGEVTSQMPDSTSGKIISILITLAGLIVFAVMVGTVSATMSNYFMTKMSAKDLTLDNLNGHLIICGYDHKVDLILEELEAVSKTWLKGVVVVAETDVKIENLPNLKNTKRLFHLNEDFTKIDILEKVGAARAKTAVVLADPGKNLSDQDRDARTVLAALTLEKINPSIFTCAELLNDKNSTHLRLAGVEEVVSRHNLSAGLFASSAVNQGVSTFISDILSHQDGNYVRKTPVPPEFVGLSFVDAAAKFKIDYDSLLVALESRLEDGTFEYHVNPPHNTVLGDEDKITLILKKHSSICEL